MDSAWFTFTPCVEVTGSEPFLADDPDLLMRRGEFHKVPVIVGGCLNEGIMVAFMKLMNDNDFENINKHPESLVPFFLGYKSGSVEETEAKKAIWDFYFKGKSLSWDTLDEYLHYQGDFLFNLGLYKTRTDLVDKSPFPVYSYIFSDHSRCILCMMATISTNENLSKFLRPGTCHGADGLFLYIFSSYPGPELTDKNKESVQKLVKAWTSFAAHGDPNCEELGVTWEKDSLTRPRFMDIGTDWDLREGIPFAERIDFWKKLSPIYFSS